MRMILLNGKMIGTNRDLHLYLKKKIQLPDFYGENLDELRDILSTSDEPTDLLLVNKEDLIESLGDYGLELIDILEEVAEENKNIKFRVSPGIINTIK